MPILHVSICYRDGGGGGIGLWQQRDSFGCGNSVPWQHVSLGRGNSVPWHADNMFWVGEIRSHDTLTTCQCWVGEIWSHDTLTTCQFWVEIQSHDTLTTCQFCSGKIRSPWRRLSTNFTWGGERASGFHSLVAYPYYNRVIPLSLKSTQLLLMLLHRCTSYFISKIFRLLLIVAAEVHSWKCWWLAICQLGELACMETVNVNITGRDSFLVTVLSGFCCKRVLTAGLCW